MPRYDDDDDRPRRRQRRDDDDEDEDDDRPRARRRRGDDDDDYDERPRRRRSKPRPQVSILGVFSLVKGIGALLLSFIPCIGVFALFPGVLGLILGGIGLVVAKKSNGRQGTGLPIAGMSVSGAAILIGLVWLGVNHYMGKQAKKWEAEEAALEAKWAAERQAEMTKAAKEVKAAPADTVVRINAVDLARAYARNPGVTDAQYEGKVVQVTGKVVKVYLEDEDDTYFIELYGTEDELTVDCHFAKGGAIKIELGDLRPGTLVTIRGKYTDGAELEGCTLVK
jgi:hypothetical protein